MRPVVATVEPPGLVGALERAAAETAQEHVLAMAQDHQVDVAIRVDVERVGTRDRGAGRSTSLLERARSAVGSRPAPIAEERSGFLAAGEVELRPLVGVAVEDRHATSDVVLEATGIACA